MEGEVFRRGNLGEFLRQRLAELHGEVQGMERNRLLSVDPANYIEYLVRKYSLEPIVLKGPVTATELIEPKMAFCDIKGDMHAAESYVKQLFSGEGERQVFLYRIPFSGDECLFWLEPNPNLQWSYPVSTEGQELLYGVVNREDSPEQIVRSADGIRGNINTQLRHSTAQVVVWNGALKDQATTIVNERRAEHLRRLCILEKLGVPVTRCDNVPATFSIPVTKKPVVVAPPSSSDAPYSPEPTLDAVIYGSILRMCYDFGVEMERHPGIYRDRTEPDIRDFFIMMLSPHFHSVTGETFNRVGRTDILVRHEGKNAFVAECKKWTGPGAHHANINQALGYLTWRDSKAALIYFVENVNLQPVLDQIVSETATHACHVSDCGQREEGWYAFRMHLLKDDTRGVEFAILCFHFPPSEEAK